MIATFGDAEDLRREVWIERRSLGRRRMLFILISGFLSVVILPAMVVALFLIRGSWSIPLILITFLATLPLLYYLLTHRVVPYASSLVYLFRNGPDPEDLVGAIVEILRGSGLHPHRFRENDLIIIDAGPVDALVMLRPGGSVGLLRVRDLDGRRGDLLRRIRTEVTRRFDLSPEVMR